MGNFHSRRRPASCGLAGKVILPNGGIRDLDGDPVFTAELMLEYPRHFVVELPARAVCATTKLAPNPADRMLDPNKAYFMIPMAHGTMLTVEDVRRIVSLARPLARSRSSAIIKIRDGGVEKVEEFGLMEKKMGGSEEWLVEVEGQEILSRQYSSRRWRPSLGTIEERSLERRKTSHWLF